MEIGYEGKKKDKLLEATTVWRWVRYVGSLGNTSRKVPNQTGPSPPPSPETIKPTLPFPRWKYRSKERKKLLGRALRLLVEDPLLERFGVFPNLALEAF